jgi:5-oxoprolinase (ATP-hydrolysing)
MSTIQVLIRFLEHACSIASKLGIDTVVIHKYSSILSAYGMALANVVQEAQEPCSLVLGVTSSDKIDTRFESLSSRAMESLSKQGFSNSDVETQQFLNLRLEGSDTQIMIQKPVYGDFRSAFEAQHKREVTFLFPNRDIVIDDIRIRVIGKSRDIPSADITREQKSLVQQPVKGLGKATRTYFKDGGWQETRVLSLSDLRPGSTILGPAIVIDNTQTIVVAPGATGTILKDHVVLHVFQKRKQKLVDPILLDTPDPIELSTFGHSE